MPPRAPGALTAPPARPLKPERIRAWEGACIQDFSALFGPGGEDQRADFKLVYFHNTVRDVIDRANETGAGFVNYDRQAIDGVELQARLDPGRFFLKESLIQSEIPCGTGMCRQNQ